MRLAIGMFDYDLPVSESAARVQKLGVGLVELVCPRNVTSSNSSEVRKQLEFSGLQTSAVATLTKPNATDDEKEVANIIELVAESARTAAALGATRAITYFGGHPSRGRDEAISRYVELIQPALDVASDVGVNVLVENHFSHAPGEVTNTARGCLDLVEAVDRLNFGVNFDPCNFAVGGQDVVEAYDILRSVVRNVHMKDTVPRDPDAHANYPGRVVTDLVRGDHIFVPMGQGVTDNATVLARLAADNYGGPVSVEAHTPQETLDDVFRIGRDYCLDHGVSL